MNTPAVSVIISARNAAATLPAALDSLARQETDADYEVIVVDNGSTDDTGEVARRHPLRARVIEGEGRGPGLARNKGVAAARAPILAFTDADCEPTTRWLKEGLGAMGDADLVQGCVSPRPGVPVGPYDRTLWVGSEYGLYETANVFVRREWFEKLGGFSDWIESGAERGRGPIRKPVRPFGEDAWFAWRARREGARTTFSSEAVVYHAVFPGTFGAYVAEQVRVRHFPALVARIPELRQVFAWHRYFLNRRTAAFDTAVVGGVAAVLTRSLLPLIVVLPYLELVRREVRRWRAHGVAAFRLTTAVFARDAVGLVSLVRGSIEARTPLL